MNRTIMSYGSAVLAVAVWIKTHGRTPTAKECCASNGLPHRVTLQYVCSGVINAVSAALGLLREDRQSEGALLRLYVTAPLPRREPQPCLRCGKLIPWQGPGMRQCQRCRKIPADEHNDWLYACAPSRSTKRIRIKEEDNYFYAQDEE